HFARAKPLRGHLLLEDVGQLQCGLLRITVTIVSPSISLRLPPRKPHREGRPAIGLALRRDLTAHRLDDLTDDPEAQPEAAVVTRRDGPLEAIEDAREILAGDADAAVANREPDLGVVARIGRPDFDRDRPALPVLHGVGDQVRQDLVEPPAIP